MSVKKSRFYVLFVFLVITSMLAVGGASNAAAKSAQPSAVQPQQQMMDQCFGAGNQPVYNSLMGKVEFASVKENAPLKKASAELASASSEAAARAYLAECGSFFGVMNTEDLTLLSQKPTGDGRSVARFQQTYQGLPVVGAQILVQLAADNSVLLVNSGAATGLKLNTKPGVTAAAARQAALQMTAAKYKTNASDLKAGAAQLSVYSASLFKSSLSAPVLVWRVDVTSQKAAVRELVLLNANTSAVEMSINQLDTAKLRKTYTANNTYTQPGTFVCGEGNPSCIGGDADAKNAHRFAGDTYDFYARYHGRDSIDNAGMALISTVHYRVGYCNAFWDGFQMTYGDGCALVVDDVVAHELTHGVTEYESNLFYAYESGAINESFSDIWGEFVDLTNGKGTDTPAVRWQIGEDTSIGAIRNMQDPTLFGDPDRMGSSLYYDGMGDNGGVHWNSGVSNKAAYLITDGDTFNGYTITGIGVAKAAKVYYEAQTNILVATSNFHSLRDALNAACSTLMGRGVVTAFDCEQVNNATLATEMDLRPLPPPAPANDDINKPRWMTTMPYTTRQMAVTATSAESDPTFPSDGSCAPWDYTIGKASGTMWYRFIPETSGYLTVDTFGSDFDTILGVWLLDVKADGTRGLTSVGCNDDSSYNYQSIVRTRLTAGKSYWIEVAGWSGSHKIQLNAKFAPILTSYPNQDGWVLESTKNSNVGGTMNATAATFRLGDDAANKQYRGVLLFNTGATLPDGAVITRATLSIKQQSIVGGGNPVASFGGFMVDVKKGPTNNAPLQVGDFQVASYSFGPFSPALRNGWYKIDLTGAKQRISKTGFTKIRLRFAVQDNRNGVADYVNFFSGNTAASPFRPQLLIEYVIPVGAQ